MIGLLGAQRVGKSTLARKFSQESNIEFLETSTSKVMKDRGFDPAKDYPLAERLEIQKIILSELSRLYRSAPVRFVTDRTPLDAAAYMLADVQRENASRSLQDEIVQYVQQCIEVTNKHFAVLLVVQPGIALVDEAGKAPAAPAHMEHIHQIITGLVSDERVTARHFYVPRRYVDLDVRVKAVRQAINRTVEHAGAELNTFMLNGGTVQ